MSTKIFVETTDENGIATFDDLPSGEYEIMNVGIPDGHDAVEVAEL